MARRLPTLSSPRARGAAAALPHGVHAADPRVWAGLWSLYIAWGSTYLAMRVMVRTIPPLLGASTRFLLAGAIVLTWVALRHGWRTLRLDRRQLLVLALSGALVPGIGNGLNTIAVTHATSVTVALLNAAVPLWVVVLRLCLRDRVHRATLIAVPVGFSGVAVLLLPGQGLGASTLGIGLALGAGVAWALGSLATARFVRGVEPLPAVAVQMLCGGLVQLVAAAVRGELSTVRPGQFSAASIAALVYLTSIGAFLSYSIFAWLLQHAPVSQVATYAFVNPVVAVILGWLILDERLAWTSLIGAAVVVGSVAFTVRHEVGPRTGDPAAGRAP